jgi:phosphate-selective porin OprO/OprP
MDIDSQVFSAGLADPNLWSNRLFVLTSGINWHLNQYVKIYLDWEHSEFGSPVQFAPGPGSVRRQLTSDTFWFRFQLYF